jgi:hypothetical protein
MLIINLMGERVEVYDVDTANQLTSRPCSILPPKPVHTRRAVARRIVGVVDHAINHGDNVAGHTRRALASITRNRLHGRHDA